MNVVNGGSGLVSKIGLNFLISMEAKILNIEPDFGPVSGGTRVIVTGTFFTLSEDNSVKTRVLCKFGESVVYATFLKQNKVISCFSPPMLNTNALGLSVSFDNGKTFSQSFIWFLYIHNAHVSRLNPKRGSVKGGTLVLVEGYHFYNKSSLVCKFGNQITYATFISSTKVLCRSPIYATVESVLLEISSNGIDFTSSGKIFSYQDDIKISSVWPLYLPTTGGTTLYVNGSGFSHKLEISCSFDGILSRAIYINETIISCKSPALGNGVSLLQIVSDGLSDETRFFPGKFKVVFHPLPTISRIFPSKGSINGG